MKSLPLLTWNTIVEQLMIVGLSSNELWNKQLIFRKNMNIRNRIHNQKAAICLHFCSGKNCPSSEV